LSGLSDWLTGNRFVRCAEWGEMRRVRPEAAPVCGLLSMMFACSAAACATPPLTVARASELLEASVALRGVEQVTYTTPKGCFVLEPDQHLDGTALDRDPQFADNRQLKAMVDRERELDLLDFEFSPTPITAPSAPEGCRRQWSAYLNAASGVTASSARLVAWRSLMSDKAFAAGLQPGRSFVTRQQRLIAIGKIVMCDDRSAVVDYTWHWEPTYEAQLIGFAPSEPKRSTAAFAWSGSNWGVVE
jgi:hypothetical protein